ncbi:Flagellin protein FlaA [Halanaerobium saccharolyticum subsp. saccharolyticum DSM 6643]|uniref:Flagellin n=1 Tax=Halanaerobium saccharolyticum subsp. saccharolyticum DSM 6643 TaxID=1293054 RepID=M5E3M9_9FIRM|nr:flagellin [Halanaerobium saccharolyticum]CCU80828.1 Flagellin protein FlaA [Halanaerobium saccharolyticum subsp. saccharolyticum DSM 6643]
MRINTNVAALNSYNQLKNTNNNLSKSLSRLSSGKRINSAADDAAGLAISEKMNSQIKGLAQAQRNAQDGISMIQTAEGALKETHSILQRMRELTVQASSDTNTDADRTEIQKEVNNLTSELNRIGNTTEFNTQEVLDGSMEGAGSGATGGQMTLGFNSVTDGDKYDITVGEDTWTVTANLADANDDADSIDTSAKTMTIDVANGAGADAAFGAALQDAFDDLANGTDNSGANGTNTVDENLSNFTFTDNSNEITIKANDAGDFAGSDDVRGIIDSSATGTGTIDELNATDGTEGTGGTAKIQIGSNMKQAFSVDISDMRSNALNIAGTAGSTVGSNGAAFTAANTVTDGTNNTNVEAALDVSTHDKATAAIEILDEAIGTVSAERSKLGAYQNRLDHTINNLSASEENITAAESRISDVDMAKEMMNMSKQQILSQAGTAMMAQANQLPQGVLQLLG